MYNIKFAEETVDHISAIDKKHHSQIVQKIEEQLTHEPNVRTRNRKPLEGNTTFGQDVWEIRFGQHNRFRVFYRMDIENSEVTVLAIGIKEENRLYIGGEEVEL